MIFGEWDEEEYRRVMKREAFEDGHDAGVAEGAQQTARQNARNFLHMNILTPEQIAQGTGLSLDAVLAIKDELSNEVLAQ